MKSLGSQNVLCLLLLELTVTLYGCSEPTRPSNAIRDAGALFEGNYDPAAETFVLDRVQIPIPGQDPVFLELVASNLRTDSRQETVSLDVGVRNAGSKPLYPPAAVWLSSFRPAGVSVRNADVVRDSSTSPTRPAFVVAYGFDYSDLLGEDRVLEPGEKSRSKLWVFHDPGLVSFAFSAQARFSLEPDRPHVSGTMFFDDNRNGLREPNEQPFAAAEAVLSRPDGTSLNARPASDGIFSLPIATTGLHTLRFNVEIDVPLCETTPNPLQIIILPGPNGEPESFEEADFGVAVGTCSRFDVLLTESLPDEIEQDPYHLIDVGLSEDTLLVDVSFSGCSPDHPFTLYARLPFMESFPVATWVLLAHSDRGELCDAEFRRNLAFHLGPLQEEYFRQYGRNDPIRLLFRDFNAAVKELILQP